MRTCTWRSGFAGLAPKPAPLPQIAPSPPLLPQIALCPNSASALVTVVVPCLDAEQELDKVVLAVLVVVDGGRVGQDLAEAVGELAQVGLAEHLLCRGRAQRVVEQALAAVRARQRDAHGREVDELVQRRQVVVRQPLDRGRLRQPVRQPLELAHAPRDPDRELVVDKLRRQQQRLLRRLGACGGAGRGDRASEGVGAGRASERTSEGAGAGRASERAKGVGVRGREAWHGAVRPHVRTSRLRQGTDHA